MSPELPVRIGLVDLGLDPEHPALRGASIRHRRVAGRGDPHLHGTRSAALLLGRAGLDASQAPVELWVATVGRRASDVVLARALRWVWQSAAPSVLALPLGRRRLGPRARAAVDALIAGGVQVVAAAGNAGPDVHLEPAALPGVTSVSGVDSEGRVVSFCCASERVDRFAPGKDVPTGVGRPDVTSGSSPACALVARWIALGDRTHGKNGLARGSAPG